MGKVHRSTLSKLVIERKLSRKKRSTVQNSWFSLMDRFFNFRLDGGVWCMAQLGNLFDGMTICVECNTAFYQLT